MTRDEAFAYLSTQLATVLTDVGVVLTDTASLDSVINQALLWQGVAWSDLSTAVVIDADVPGYLALLEYAGLRYVYNQALNRTDISISDPNVSKSRSQFVRSLENALKMAKDAADPFIISGSSFETGAIAFGDDLCVDEYSPYGWPGAYSCL